MKRWALFVVALAVGCAPDYGGLAVEIEGVSLAGDYVDARRVNLVVGHVVRIHARPRSLTSKSYENPDRFELAPANPDILRTYRDAEDWRWVLVARATGTTCVEVRIDGREEECIEVSIQAEAG